MKWFEIKMLHQISCQLTSKLYDKITFLIPNLKFICCSAPGLYTSQLISSDKTCCHYINGLYNYTSVPGFQSQIFAFQLVYQLKLKNHNITDFPRHDFLNLFRFFVLTALFCLNSYKFKFSVDCNPSLFTICMVRQNTYDISFYISISCVLYMEF